MLTLVELGEPWRALTITEDTFLMAKPLELMTTGVRLCCEARS